MIELTPVQKKILSLKMDETFLVDRRKNEWKSFSMIMLNMVHDLRGDNVIFDSFIQWAIMSYNGYRLFDRLNSMSIEDAISVILNIGIHTGFNAARYHVK